MLTHHATAPPLGTLSSTSEAKPWETPPAPIIDNCDFPGRLAIVKSNALYTPLNGLSAKAANHLKRIASFKNPEFYSRQAMRLTTHNVPRIISCADIVDDYLVLPRGSLASYTTCDRFARRTPNSILLNIGATMFNFSANSR